MPFALITAAAAGDVMNLMNSFAAAGSFAPVPISEHLRFVPGAAVTL
jgi:hypothetical protein